MKGGSGGPLLEATHAAGGATGVRGGNGTPALPDDSLRLLRDALLHGAPVSAPLREGLMRFQREDGREGRVCLALEALLAIGGLSAQQTAEIFGQAVCLTRSTSPFVAMRALAIVLRLSRRDLRFERDTARTVERLLGPASAVPRSRVLARLGAATVTARGERDGLRG